MFGKQLGRLALVIGLIFGFGTSFACSGNRKPNGNGSGSTGKEPPPPTFTLFALAELRGQIEPCGCTTDPLGDLARTVKIVSDARAEGPVLMVDAGSILYSKNPVPEAMESQEALKADLIATTYSQGFRVAALGLGPADLAEGPDKVQLPRQLANAATPLPTGFSIEQPEVFNIGGAKVGVFGVTAPDAVTGVNLTDPVEAAKRVVADLRARGAQMVVGLITATTKPAALDIVRGSGGIDLAILSLGSQAPEPGEVSDQLGAVGDGWYVVPGNRGQVLSRLDITIRQDGVLVDAVGPAAAAAAVARATEQVAALDAELAKFATDPDADEAFVARKKAERATAVQNQAALTASPWRIPASGNYVALTQIRIDRALACSPEIVASKAEFDKAAGAANVAKAKAAPPPQPVPPGTATYVGTEECSNCHSSQTEFWRTTRHAKAWETLEKVNKQFDFDCISCHVTGWDKPGGASMSSTELLQDVQCETCHGPGSLHVEADGEDMPRTIVRSPAAGLCAGACHTKEHSDTFELTAYLRDVLGPGHGEEARKALGDGPTGHELRTAGLAKAAKSVGPGCSK